MKIENNQQAAPANRDCGCCSCASCRCNPCQCCNCGACGCDGKA